MIIADKGFRRCKCKHTLLIPHSIPKGLKQLPTQAANETRKITRVRNVIERLFGWIKNMFKFMYNIIDSRYVPKIHEIWRLLCAVYNWIGPPLFEIENEKAANDVEIISVRMNDKPLQGMISVISNKHTHENCI